MKKIILFFFLSLGLLTLKAAAMSNATDSANIGYKVLNKSKNVGEIKIRQMKSKKAAVIYLALGNKKLTNNDDNASSYGFAGTSRSEELKKQIGPTISRVSILKGRYGDMTADKKSDTQNVYTLKDIQFPLSIKVFFGSENVTLEFEQESSWDVEVGTK